MPQLIFCEPGKSVIKIQKDILEWFRGAEEGKREEFPVSSYEQYKELKKNMTLN